MRSKQVRRGIGILVIGVAVASCSTGSKPTIDVASAPGPLSSVCAAKIIGQMSWYPESTEGGMYAALGGHLDVDANHKQVTGDLYDQGKPTGVRLTLRSGGPAVANEQASELMKLHPEILIGQESTDDVISSWTRGNPTVVVLAPLAEDPVVYMWDQTQHPEWNTINDIGQTYNTVFTFPSASKDYLVGQGVLRGAQINTSFDGSATFLREHPKAAVGGFSTNEVYLYRRLGIKVAYAYVSDAGFPNYRNALIVRKPDVTGQAACLAKLIPVFQRSAVSFLLNPEPTLKVIADLDKRFSAPYPYALEQGRYGVHTMWQDGLVANGSDGVFGSVDVAPKGRLEIVRDDLIPVYRGRHQPVPDGITGAALGTNQFLDKSVKLPASQEPK